MFLSLRTRARTRALIGVTVSGLGLGAVVGCAGLAALNARAAAGAPAASRLADAAKMGYSGRAMQPLPPPPDPAPIASAPAAKASGDLDCLSAAVYYEARGEVAAGQAAVAQVVLNRVGRAAFPKTVCGVVYQGAGARVCQFSFVCDGAMRRPLEPAAWARARLVAERALGGQQGSIVGKATSFHAVRLGGLWGPGMIQVAQIGGHSFYSPAGGARRRAYGYPASGATRPAAPAPERYTFALGLLVRVPPAKAALAAEPQVPTDTAPPAAPTEAS